jgi:hypothetical protein
VIASVGSKDQAGSTTLRTTGQLGDVTLSPTKITLQDTSGCPFGWTWLGCGDDDAEAQISGPGTKALPGKGVISTATLSGDRSGTTRVELRREGSQWIVVIVDSTLGSKSGDLPLIPGASPSLTITVQDGYWFGIAVGLVLLGSLIGGFLLPHYGIARRRGILVAAVNGALDRYKEAVADAKKSESAADPHVARPAGYRIGEELGDENEWNTRGCQPYQGPRGVRNLLCRIVTSRADADFTEVEGQATKLINMIDGWIALEPVIAEAKRALERAKQAPNKSGERFVDAKVCADFAQLISAAEGYRPLSLDEVENRVSQLQAQQAAVMRAEEVWRATIRVLSVAGPLEPAVAERLEGLPGVSELKTNVAPSPPHSVDEALDLGAQLRAALDQIQEYETVLPKAEEVAQVHKPALAAAREELSAVAERIESTEEAAMELESQVATPAVSPTPEVMASRKPRVPTQHDFLLSLVAGLGASIAYAATIYSDTWGSFPQMASALAAGFVTPSLAWAALPIFRSVRWPGAQVAAGPFSTTGNPAPTAAPTPTAPTAAQASAGPPVAAPAAANPPKP